MKRECRRGFAACCAQAALFVTFGDRGSACDPSEEAGRRKAPSRAWRMRGGATTKPTGKKNRGSMRPGATTTRGEWQAAASPATYRYDRHAPRAQSFKFFSGEFACLSRASTRTAVLLLIQLLTEPDPAGPSHADRFQRDDFARGPLLSSYPRSAGSGPCPTPTGAAPPRRASR
jgi:hypothetical protein